MSDLEKWAREAGCVIGQDGPDDQFEVSMHRAQIEHFARLVRADIERERDEALAALRELMMDCDHLLLECPWHTREWADGVCKMQDHARALLARVEEGKR